MMTQERIDLLEGIRFIWKIGNWTKSVEAIKKYKERHGTFWWAAHEVTDMMKTNPQAID